MEYPKISWVQIRRMESIFLHTEVKVTWSARSPWNVKARKMTAYLPEKGT